MSLNMNQSLNQNQRLMMSPRMQQAIHILQVPVLELTNIIDAELEQNPLLEYLDEEEIKDTDLKLETKELDENADFPSEKEIEFKENDFEILQKLDEEFYDFFTESGSVYFQNNKDDENLKSFMENSIEYNISLFEYLMKEAEEVFETQEEIDIARIIIGNLDERGFLTTPLEELALLNNVDQVFLEKILKEIQTFDPYGIGATNERECLLIQLKNTNKQNSIPYIIVEQHYDDLLHNRLPLISKKLKLPVADIKNAIENTISKLNLHPGTDFSNQDVQYIVPDVTVVQENDLLKVYVNEDTLPPLKINHKYLELLNNETSTQECKDYIRQKISSGKWLLKNIYQRNNTLYRIVECLTIHQREFFVNPYGKLTPLTMKTVSEELELHESTIARAVSNKYLNSPRGLLSLRSFFTNSYEVSSGTTISSQTVKDLLVEIINQENKSEPLSDEAISALIQKKGIRCARRTVAKYRKELNIGTNSQRKKYT